MPEDFKSAGFTEFKRVEDTLKVSMMGMEQEMPFKAVCFINGARTVGYAELDAQTGHDFIFLSKTDKGDVMTVPGDQPGQFPFPVEGYHSVMSVVKGSPVETYYDEHMKSVADAALVTDEQYLRTEVPNLPQRSIEVAMKIMEAMMQALGGEDGIIKQLGEAMAGAFGDGTAEVTDVTVESGTEASHEEAVKRMNIGGTKKTCPSCGKEAGAMDRTCTECGEELD
jgi:hypothetical protein